MRYTHSEIERLGLSVAKELHGILRRLTIEEDSEGNALRKFAQLCAKEYSDYHDDLMTAEEATQFLGKKSVAALKQACKTVKGQESQLPHHKFQGSLYFSRRELTEFLLSK